MSFVEKAYNHGLKVVKIFNSKIFHFFLIFFGALALIFGVMNVYAQEETLRISPDFPGNKAVYNTASGVDPDQDNTTSYGGTSLLNTSWVTAISLAPSLTEGGDAVLNNADIPNDMKYGLLGITDSAWAGIYRNTPSVDLIAHLGNEWVPGYDESSYGTYADDGANVSGYQSLIDSGIAPLWTQFRNMSYVFLVIIMLAIGREHVCTPVPNQPLV